MEQLLNRTDLLEFPVIFFQNGFILVIKPVSFAAAYRLHGFLKHLLQKPVANLRKPYGSSIQEIRRYASFIGTSNHKDLLTDSSGSRRFVCVEVTAPGTFPHRVYCRNPDCRYSRSEVREEG